MTIIKKGLHIELTNRSTNRVILSAATDELDKKVFDEIWSAIGDSVFGKAVEQVEHYEIRIAPIQ